MDAAFDRTALLLGAENFNKLRARSVAVVGIGGVGGAAAEALYRAGIGKLILLDHDTVDATNLNRQLFATADKIGESKCAAAKARLTAIHKQTEIVCIDSFYSAENRAPLFDSKPDLIIDAIDTVSAKLDLIETAVKNGIPIVSSMGTGNRFDPSKFTLGDIADTAGCGCGLARVMRRELKKRGITTLPVVYSTEQPKITIVEDGESGRHAPGSISYCPPVAGYILASYVIRKIIE